MLLPEHPTQYVMPLLYGVCVCMHTHIYIHTYSTLYTRNLLYIDDMLLLYQVKQLVVELLI